MSLSLYDVSVASYLQVLHATAGVLEKGKAHCEEAGTDMEDVVESRLIEDMNPFRFQVISVAHHSMGTLKAMASGEFAPPSGYGEPDYAGCQALVQEAIAYAEGLDRDEVNGYESGTITFKLGGNELPFSVANFVNSFSLPNFYFHAATTYDILRMKGVPLGKRDFLGNLRMGV